MRKIRTDFSVNFHFKCGSRSGPPYQNDAKLRPLPTDLTRLLCEPIGLHFEPPQLFLQIYADPDPTFHKDTDLSPASRNAGDPDLLHSQGFRTRIDFNADPDTAFYLIKGPNPALPLQ